MSRLTCCMSELRAAYRSASCEGCAPRRLCATRTAGELHCGHDIHTICKTPYRKLTPAHRTARQALLCCVACALQIPTWRFALWTVCSLHAHCWQLLRWHQILQCRLPCKLTNILAARHLWSDQGCLIASLHYPGHHRIITLPVEPCLLRITSGHSVHSVVRYASCGSNAAVQTGSARCISSAAASQHSTQRKAAADRTCEPQPAAAYSQGQPASVSRAGHHHREL